MGGLHDIYTSSPRASGTIARPEGIYNKQNTTAHGITVTYTM